jgi:hypothetical protein
MGGLSGYWEEEKGRTDFVTLNRARVHNLGSAYARGVAYGMLESGMGDVGSRWVVGFTPPFLLSILPYLLLFQALDFPYQIRMHA